MFRCPQDGHFGDPDDCTKFYRCAHGTALPDFCPNGLFWNRGKKSGNLRQNIEHDLKV